MERMDFDIGSLIYILFALIAVFAGAAGKKKKPGAPGASQGQGAGKGFLSNLGREFQGILDQATQTDAYSEEFEPEAGDQLDPDFAYDRQAEEVVETYENERPSSFAAFEGELNPEMIRNQELIEAEAERGTELEVVELDEESYVDYYEIVEDFDLGTAVIYSAIINRPDY